MFAVKFTVYCWYVLLPPPGIGVPLRSRIAPAGGGLLVPGSALIDWSVWAGAANTMSTVQQRRVKAIFFKVVRVVAGIRCLFIGTSLFSLVRLRDLQLLCVPSGKFPLALETRIYDQKGSLTFDKSLGASRNHACILQPVVPTPPSRKTQQAKRGDFALESPACQGNSALGISLVPYNLNPQKTRKVHGAIVVVASQQVQVIAGRHRAMVRRIKSPAPLIPNLCKSPRKRRARRGKGRGAPNLVTHPIPLTAKSNK